MDAFAPIINAYASKASVSDLLVLLVFSFLAWLILDDRKRRSEDVKLLSEALEKSADSYDKVASAMTELRIAIARHA